MEIPDICQTAYSGHVDLQPDQQHALVTISNAGAVWEVDLESGQVVWEYLVSDPVDPALRACVGYAAYADHLSFLQPSSDNTDSLSALGGP